MILAQDRTALCRIVIAEPCMPSVRRAADELAGMLWQMSGADFAVAADVLKPQKNDILLGKSRRTDALGLSDEMDALPKEGFFIRTTDENLVIGGVGRGLLYGVYSFLEDVLGCRFFSPEISSVPYRERIGIPALDYRGAPAMEYREPYLTEFKDADFAARRRVNGQSAPLTEKHGGGVKYADGFFVHTMTKLLPPETYFDEHPEYYAEVNGKRLRENTQLCLSNPDVLGLVTARVLEELRRQPEAGLFSVSQDDNYNACTCGKCRAVNEEEGSMSGALIRFVNAVAEAVEREFPDVVIDTLAYQYTRKPPRMLRPRHNVGVRLCTIECCFVHPLRDCRAGDPDAPDIGLSAPFADDLTGWGKICSRLYVWDYVTNFSHYWMPHPNFHVLADNVRFFAENGVKGVFEQGCIAAGGGELTGLRAYLLSKLLWDPGTDEQIVIDEYLSGVYGAAGPYIKAYMEEVYRAVNEKGCHLYCFNHPDKPWHTMELVKRCEALFDRAESAVSDGEVLYRVKKERMAVRYLRILLTKKGSPERIALLDSFEADVRNFGLTQLWERDTVESSLHVLRGEKEPGYWWNG